MAGRFSAICRCIAPLGITLLGLGLASSGARADAPASPSLEFTLLENVIALQGQKLSRQAMETELNALLTQYSNTVQTQGQLERLEQALVDLNIYSPPQAEALAEQVAHAAQNSAEMGESVPNALADVLRAEPEGAEFSGCALSGGVLVGVSAFVLLIGYTLQKFATEAGDTPGTDRALVIGGVGVAAGVALIVAGAEGGC